jgi:hypothetical protein
MAGHARACDPTDPVVDRGPIELVHPEPLDERDPGIPPGSELGENRRDGSLVVATRRRDPDLIPARLGHAVDLENPFDPAGEAATVGLDDVAETLVRGPLAGRGSPARPVIAERGQLGDDVFPAGAEEGRDPDGGERLEPVDRRHVGRVEGHQASPG